VLSLKVAINSISKLVEVLQPVQIGGYHYLVNNLSEINLGNMLYYVIILDYIIT